MGVIFDPKAIKWTLDQIYFEIPKLPANYIVETK